MFKSQFKFFVVDRRSLAATIISPERAKQIQEEQPFDGHRPAYNSFAGSKLSTGTGLIFFKGQGVEYKFSGQFGVIHQLDDQSALVRFKGGKMWVPFSSLNQIPSPKRAPVVLRRAA